ncbi:unnamed protein product [Phytomonas sp. Hart1]|nr:unnamed protein product [Phytomonas sp. Hart1]|eukprot:CCW68842.1 unnamed protein product [Phytomonas sp. isolate Hart1]
MSQERQALQKVNLEEINETTGFYVAEEYVWKAFEKGFLTAGEDADGDVNSWVERFCSEAEEHGTVFDQNFVKSICTLGIYAGLRDEFHQRSGCGKSIYPNRDEYEGEFFQGKKNGSGHYIFLSKGKNEIDKIVEAEIKAIYNGDLKKTDETAIRSIAEKYQIGIHIVAGVIEYGFFPCYHGDYAAGKRSGCGIMKNKDATIYKGEFLENKREGQGVFYYLNGDIYSGNWKGGLKHGYGTYHFVGGGEYRGEWVNGVFTQGQWILQDGTYYEGKFDKLNRPLDTNASMHYPRIKLTQFGTFKRGLWAPTSQLQVCDEVPIDGIAWVD